MGVESFKLKFTGLCFMMLFFDAATVKYRDPVLEVVSIYNDNFTTPDSREPYFIKVHRCVDYYSINCSLDVYAIPVNYTRIKIFVPDLNNRTKFYRYVVYNHTNCTCGDAKAKKLNWSMREVNESEFWKGYRWNPVNLRKESGFCNKRQPRYRQHTDFEHLNPQSRYYFQYQCLPGCWHESEVIRQVIVMTKGNFKNSRTFLSDRNCKAYAPSHEPPSKDSCTTGNIQPSNPVSHNLFGSKKSSNDNESKDNLIISIASARLFVAALVLSFLLLIFLILDFGFCRKQKGFFYALCGCTGVNSAEHFCHNCEQRRINELTV